MNLMPPRLHAYLRRQRNRLVGRRGGLQRQFRRMHRRFVSADDPHPWIRGVHELSPAEFTKQLQARAQEGVEGGHAERLRDELDRRDAQGLSALHHAVLRKRPEHAVQLLEHGACSQLLDREGRRPFDQALASAALVHRIRQQYHRLPEAREQAGRHDPWFRSLERDGIVHVQQMIDAEMVAHLRAAVGRFVASIEDARRRGLGTKTHYDEEEHWWPSDQAYVTNNAFKYAPQLASIVTDPRLVRVIEAYLGGPAHVQRGVGMRYLPAVSTGRDMFAWHHDMEERRLKIQILLTDVGEGDQAMHYLKGSQRLFHDYAMFHENRCSPRYCQSKLGPLEVHRATGRAGDLILFDSNGAHRGTRRATAALRDVFFVEFSRDASDVWGGDLDRGVVRELGLVACRLFAPFLAAEKKWLQPVTRRAPSWIENLREPARWRRREGG